MASSMLEKDIDEIHRQSTDGLLTTPLSAAATLPKGGDVEMSLLRGIEEQAPAGQEQQHQQHQQHQQQQQRQQDASGAVGGMQEASSEWVTPNDAAKQESPDKNRLSRREVLVSAMLVVGMVLITTISVTVAVKNHNQQSKESSALPQELEGRIQFDPVANKWVSSYVLPTRLVPTTVTDQDELDIIIAALSNNQLLSGKASGIPKTVAELASIGTVTDPYVLGAQWLTSADSYNGMEHVINRYALAVFYYSLSGDKWYNQTNWLSSTEYYCNWHGVVCCNDHVRTSTLCNSNDFGKIMEIDLFRNNLIGDIPDVISLFNSSLYSLYLSENSITGTIPSAALASMSQFGSFIAAYNFLTGTIPAELNANDIFNTLYIQGNDINGTFPKALQPCVTCNGVEHFGFDCDKIFCNSNLCIARENCFRQNNTITVKQ